MWYRCVVSRALQERRGPDNGGVTGGVMVGNLTLEGIFWIGVDGCKL